MNLMFTPRMIEIFNERLKDAKFKTEMCKNWEKDGSCPYNNKCRFAHGKNELMVKEKNASFHKIKDCYTFFRYGYCLYGRRCCYRHDERSINIIQRSYSLEVLVQILKIISLNYQGLMKVPPRRRLQVFQTLTDDTNKGTSEMSIRSLYSELTNSRLNLSIEVVDDEMKCKEDVHENLEDKTQGYSRNHSFSEDHLE